MDIRGKLFRQSEPALWKWYEKPLGSSSNALVSTSFLEPDGPLNVFKALGSRLLNTQHFLTRVAKEDVHGYQHTSYHYSSRSAARRRRLVRSWTLVLSTTHTAVNVTSKVESFLEPRSDNGIAGGRLDCLGPR